MGVSSNIKLKVPTFHSSVIQTNFTDDVMRVSKNDKKTSWLKNNLSLSEPFLQSNLSRNKKIKQILFDTHLLPTQDDTKRRISYRTYTCQLIPSTRTIADWPTDLLTGEDDVV